MHKSDSFSSFQSERYFPGLDCLRAIAILLVFTAHPRDRTWLGVIHGPVGVTLFFVISGFLITHLLIKEERKFGKVDFRSFYLRRLFRIYPLYFAVLLIYIFLILICGFLPERKEIFIEHLPLLVSPFPELTWFFHDSQNAVPFNGSWSIGIEEKFYLVWPFIGFFLLRKKLVSRLIFLFLSFVIFALCNRQQNIFLILAPYGPIAVGAFFAILLNNRRIFIFLEKASQFMVRIFLLAVTLVLSFSTSEILIGGSLYPLVSILIGLNIALHLVSKNSWWIFQRSMILRYLGTISYSFYLTHNFAINFIEALIPQRDSVLFESSVTCLSLILSIFVAATFTKILEIPARNFGRRLSAGK
jgi:hypothetical protein